MLKPMKWGEIEENKGRSGYTFMTLKAQTPIRNFYITWNNAFDGEFYCVGCPDDAEGMKFFHVESLAAAKEKAQEIFQELVLDCFDDKVHVIEDKERGKSIICNIISL